MENFVMEEAERRRIARRHRQESLFRRAGMGAIVLSITAVFLLFGDIISKGYSAFQTTELQLKIELPANQFLSENLADANYPGIIKAALRELFPEVVSRADKKRLYHLLSRGAAFSLQQQVEETPSLIGGTLTLWLPASSDVDMYIKGHISSDTDEDLRRLNNKQLAWIKIFVDRGALKTSFNTTFFSSGDSREPELAGIRGALVGSLYTMLLTLALSFPLGVATAIYLEEFAKRSWWRDIIEVNINNLAAVPSIIFGLLGLAVCINFWGMPRSTPLVGGTVLALMTLPTVIIASRAALQSVPPSIREAALGVGASKVQVVFHHVLPLALPGMLTGTIIGMAQALGETAPLLMVGMIAFIVDVPGSISDPATVLPVQIFLWADSPERGFTEKSSAAILVLLLFLICMNACAVFLRKKFETKW